MNSYPFCPVSSGFCVMLRGMQPPAGCIYSHPTYRKSTSETLKL